MLEKPVNYCKLPIKELETAELWLHALFEWAYNCENEVPDYNRDKMLKNLSSIMKFIDTTASISKVQYLGEDRINVIEWVSEALAKIENPSLNQEKSLQNILQRGPAYTESSLVRNRHRLLLLEKFISNPPRFFKALAMQDDELAFFLKFNKEEYLSQTSKLQPYQEKDGEALTKNELYMLKNCFQSGTKNQRVLEQYILSFGECVRYVDLQHGIWGMPSNDLKRPYSNAEKASSDVRMKIIQCGFDLDEHKAQGKTVGRKMIRIRL